MPAAEGRSMHQHVYQITTCIGRTPEFQSVSGKSTYKVRQSIPASSSKVSPRATASKPNRLVDRTIYESTNLSTQRIHPHFNLHCSTPCRYKELLPLWDALELSTGERNYASKTLANHPEYREAYEAKLQTLAELRTAFRELTHERRESVTTMRKIIRMGKGSKRVLVYLLTKIKRLTILISTITNLARIICKKPVSLQPFAFSSDSPELNWITYLQSECLYSVETVALLFVIFEFESGQTYASYLRLVREYFRTISSTESDDHFVINSGNLIVEGCNDDYQSQPASVIDSHEVINSAYGEISLYFLLGLKAEAIFEHDCLGNTWDAFLHAQPGVFHTSTTFSYTLLSPEQILAAVKNERKMLAEFREHLTDIKLAGSNVPLVPVIPNNPNLEIYTEKITDVEDDNILLAEVASRWSRVHVPRVVMSSPADLEASKKNLVPPSSVREGESSEGSADKVEPMVDDKSNLTSLITTFDETMSKTTLTLDSSKIS